MYIYVCGDATLWVEGGGIVSLGVAVGDEGPAVLDVGAHAAGGAPEHVGVALQHVVDGGLRHGGEQRAHVRHHVVQARALRVHLPWGENWPVNTFDR